MLAAEERLRSKIGEKEQLLEETQQALSDYRRQLEALVRLKGLLAAEGDTLEALLKEALAQLGLEVAAGSEGEGLVIKDNGDLIPLEMAAAKGAVPERALRRLINRLSDDPPAGCKARGVLVGSAHLETPLEERLKAGFAPCFEERLAEQARGFGICLLSLKDVFRVLTGQAEAARDEFKANVLNTKGPFSQA